MPNIVYIATSLDGFIAKKDGGIDWLLETPNPEGSDFGFSEFMKSVDAIVMGRNTFELVLTFGKWLYTKPVFVLSNTLQSVPKNVTDRAEILSGNPESIIKELNSRGYKNFYIDGGITIQKFLDQELIDELIITRIPILLGDGIPLFAGLTKEQNFEHLNTEVYNNSLVKSHYKRKI
ncbi:MAG: bifunctional deaminase-reductase domain-containing protein [Stygiobacter sp.]|nr:MAG: bifunctional deaminase-reductase domain-containing protein [Stygiobacter sp.]KAF0213911.1 MAG: bifunctional deaminase-reductase domain-containing [Ignavibacteria bacterium]